MRFMVYPPYGFLIRTSTSIMASATPSPSVPGTSTAAPEARGVGKPRRHAQWPHVAAAVIAAAMRAAVRLAVSHDHVCTRTNSTPCLPSSSVTSL
jgi:hypothetical protein